MDNINDAYFEKLSITLRVEDLMPILGIGRNTAYNLVRSGDIFSIRIGRQLRIPRAALIEFLHGRNSFSVSRLGIRDLRNV